MWWKSSRQLSWNFHIAYVLYDTPRGVERCVLSFRRFPAALLGCGTWYSYAPFVVQLPSDIYENVTYKGECGRSSLSNVVCTKTSTRFCTACGLVVRSDAEEHVAENAQPENSTVPQPWTKNVMFLWDFGRLPSAMCVVKKNGNNAA